MTEGALKEERTACESATTIEEDAVSDAAAACPEPIVMDDLTAAAAAAAVPAIGGVSTAGDPEDPESRTRPVTPLVSASRSVAAAAASSEKLAPGDTVLAAKGGGHIPV